MLSFYEYLETLKKKYVALQVSQESTAKLREYAKENGFDLTVSFSDEPQKETDFDFHVTVYFTTNTHRMTNGIFDIPEFEIHPTQLKVLGVNEDIPVIGIEPSGQLMTYRNRYTRLGFRDAWPDYLPHISLSYNRKEYDMSKIPLPNFPITVNKLKVADVKE